MLFCLSDHKPIFGLYKIRTEKIDKEIRNALAKEIHKNKSSKANQLYFNFEGKINKEMEDNFFKGNVEQNYMNYSEGQKVINLDNIQNLQ